MVQHKIDSDPTDICGQICRNNPMHLVRTGILSRIELGSNKASSFTCSLVRVSTVGRGGCYQPRSSYSRRPFRLVCNMIHIKSEELLVFNLTRVIHSSHRYNTRTRPVPAQTDIYCTLCVRSHWPFVMSTTMHVDVLSLFTRALQSKF